MLSNRLGRLLAFVLSIIGVVIILSLASNSGDLKIDYLLFSLIFSLAIGAIHLICGDLLDFGFLDNVVGRFIKRFLFFGVTIGVCFLTSVLYFELDSYYVWGYFIQDVCLGSSIASGFSVAIMCILENQLDWDEEKRPFRVYFGLIPAFVFGIILALLGEDFHIIGGILVILLGLGGIVFVTGRYGFIYGGEPLFNFGGGSSGSSGRRNNSILPDEVYDEYLNGMYLIARKHNISTSLSYGARARLSNRVSIYGNTLSIYVDIHVDFSHVYNTASGSGARVGTEASDFRRNQLRKIFDDLESLVNRMTNRYGYYDIDYEVQPGECTTSQ